MKTTQKNKLESYRAIKALLSAKMAASEDPGLVATFAVFVDNLDIINALIEAQSTPLTGQLQARNHAFREAQDAALAVAGRVLAHAAAARKPQLAARVRVKPSRFAAARLVSRLALMHDVHEAATEVLPELAPLGVTPPALADLAAKIASAEAAFDLPRGVIVARKVATAELHAAFRAMDTHLRESLDGVMVAVRSTDPTLYASYREARRVIARPGNTGPREVAAAAATPLVPENAQPLAA